MLSPHKTQASAPRSAHTVLQTHIATIQPAQITTPSGITLPFENGSTQGWQRVGNVLSLQNSTDEAHGGKHSLQIIFQSHDARKDYPYIYYQNSQTSPYIKPGAILTMYIYVPQKTVQLWAKPFVTILHAGQFASGSLMEIPSQRWYKIQMSIPQGTSSWDTLGLQMHNNKVNVNTTFYIDDVQISVPAKSSKQSNTKTSPKK
jgi:hypothetical protein